MQWHDMRPVGRVPAPDDDAGTGVNMDTVGLRYAAGKSRRCPMIRTILVIALAALPVQVMADEPKPAPETTSLSESAPPPPGLNDPGVQTESAPRAVD